MLIISPALISRLWSPLFIESYINHLRELFLFWRKEAISFPLASMWCWLALDEDRAFFLCFTWSAWSSIWVNYFLNHGSVNLHTMFLCVYVTIRGFNTIWDDFNLYICWRVLFTEGFFFLKLAETTFNDCVDANDRLMVSAALVLPQEVLIVLNFQ